MPSIINNLVTFVGSIPALYQARKARKTLAREARAWNEFLYTYAKEAEEAGRAMCRQ